MFEIKERTRVFVVNGPYFGSVGVVASAEYQDIAAGVMPVIICETNEMVIIPVKSLVLVVDVNR